MIHENYEISPSSDDSRVRVRSLQGDRCAPLCAQYPCDGAKRYCSNRHSSCVCDGRWRSSPTVAVERPVATTGRPLRALVRAVMSLDENNNKLTDRSRPETHETSSVLQAGFRVLPTGAIHNVPYAQMRAVARYSPSVYAPPRRIPEVVSSDPRPGRTSTLA